MKFKKPNKKSSMDAAVLVGSAATGAMVSRGVDGLLPKKSLMANAVQALLAGFVSASQIGKGTSADAIKGFFAGWAIENIKEVLQEVALKNVQTQTISNAKMRAFAEAALGVTSGSGLSGIPISFTPYENQSIIDAEALRSYEVENQVQDTSDILFGNMVL